MIQRTKCGLHSPVCCSSNATFAWEQSAKEARVIVTMPDKAGRGTKRNLENDNCAISE